MKRERNRSRHPAMLRGQLVERLDSGRIAQDAGNLPALVAVRGLALCAGLGLHGSGGNQVRNRIHILRLDRHFMGDCKLSHQSAITAHLGNDEAAQLVAGLDGFAELNNVAGFHVASPLCVGGSSHVTSDTSTTVRRVAP